MSTASRTASRTVADWLDASTPTRLGAVLVALATALSVGRVLAGETPLVLAVIPVAVVYAIGYAALVGKDIDERQRAAALAGLKPFVRDMVRLYLPAGLVAGLVFRSEGAVYAVAALILGKMLCVVADWARYARGERALAAQAQD